MPVPHHRFTRSLLLALIPACALVGGLPFVNRLEPTVFHLPFLLFWILGWVVVTPLFLFLAYRAGGGDDGGDGDGAVTPQAGTEAGPTRVDAPTRPGGGAAR